MAILGGSQKREFRSGIVTGLPVLASGHFKVGISKQGSDWERTEFLIYYLKLMDTRPRKQVFIRKPFDK